MATDDDFEGGPELVVEIASSTASHDLLAKFEVYRRNGVREYLVWRVRDGGIDWFVLRDGHHRRLEPSAEGTLRSEAFPGLWLVPSALIRGDMPAAFGAGDRGLATPEHAEFVARRGAASQGN